MLVADPGRVARMSRRWPQVEIQLAPFPAFDEGDGRPSSYVELRVLALPSNGPYPSLAMELIRALASAEPELLAGEGASFLAASRGHGRGEDWERLMSSAFALPLFSRRSDWEDAVGHAIEQSLQRKRNPTQAILDAREMLNTPNVR